MDALLRRRMMMLAGVTPGPGPEPPTPVNIPYIRGGADGSYIDTGIKPDSTTRVIVWARNWNPTSSFLFGARNALDNAMFSLTTNDNSQTGRIRIDYAGTHSTITGDQFANLSGYHKYELFQGVLKIDDEVIASASTGTFSCNYNLHIFGNNNGGTHGKPSLPIDICACQIYKGGTLVRDFTAVESPSVGLYDAVSDTVFANAGSGSFAYGIFDKNAYVPLQYIECSNEQMFDSGVYGSYALRIAFKFRPMDEVARWEGVLGCRISSPASCCDFTLGTDTSRNSELSIRLGASTAYKIGANIHMLDVVVYKNDGTASSFVNGAQNRTSTTGATSGFVTSDTLTIGRIRSGESTYVDAFFRGRFYYIGLGSERSYVPAKVNNVAGMYDTYNDVFYPSESGTAFIAGPTL